MHPSAPGWRNKLTFVSQAIIAALTEWEDVTENARLNGRVVIFLAEYIGGNQEDLPALRRHGLLEYHPTSQSYSVSGDAMDRLRHMSLVGDPSVVRAIPEGGLKRLHLHLVRDPDMVKHLSESMLDHPPSPHVLSASDVTDLLVADMMDAVVGMFEDITGRLDARKSARMKAQAALRRHARAQMRSNCEPIPRSEAIAAFSPPYRNPRQARAAIRHLKSEGLLVECKDGFLAITGAGYDFAFGKAA